MIEYRTGNMFDSDADCLVNTVNCEGYMGKGIAYQFKMRFPENNKQYIKECRSGTLKPGTLFVFKEEGKTIINFPTKDKWREKSKEEYIVSGMKELVRLLPGLGVKTIVIPPLGCGNGGLNWGRVKKIIIDTICLVQEKYRIIVYEPASENYPAKIKQPPILSACALLLIRMKQKLHTFTNLRMQKTAFFTNFYLGSPYFHFVRGKYGPYSHDINIVAKSIAEYSQYYDIKDANLLYKSVYRTTCSNKTDEMIFQMDLPIGKAIDFVNGITDDHELEGIATALFLIEDAARTEEEIWQGFAEWPGDKAARFKHSEMSNFIAALEVAGFISCNLLGQYEVSNLKYAV